MTYIDTSQSVTLNVSYELPDDVWSKIAIEYERMPGWLGYENGIPIWFGREGDPENISASVEPSGLLIDGEMEAGKWRDWVDQLCSNLSTVLGYQVKDAEV